MQLSANTLLQGGKYRIIRYIAQGGFGITYEGLHILLGKKVAIKEFFISDFCYRDNNSTVMATESKVSLVSKLRKKFIAEACAINSLDHPGIVKVHDVFEENGTAYYVMDFIEGETLDSKIKRKGKLPEAEVRKYLTDIAAALEYVHSRNRLHLDIKPANIMVDNGTDHAKLIDFGVSKQYDEENGQNTSTLVGKTPGYAPIEQLNAEVQMFSPATDIYALAATLYKALSGNVPPTPSTILESGLPQLPAEVSDTMKQVIKKGMQLTRKDRFQSIEEMMAALDDNSESEVTIVGVTPKPTPETVKPIKIKDTTIHPRPTQSHTDRRSKNNHHTATVIVSILCVLVAAFAFYLISSPSSSPNSAYYSAEDLEVTPENIERYANVKNETFDRKIDELITTKSLNHEDPDFVYNMTLYLANKGYSDFYHTLGCWYRYATGPGKYKKTDLNEALKWFKKGAELDDMGCANEAGEILEGMGQLELAHEYYTKALNIYYRYSDKDKDYWPPNALCCCSTPIINRVEEAISRTATK